MGIFTFQDGKRHWCDGQLFSQTHVWGWLPGCHTGTSPLRFPFVLCISSLPIIFGNPVTHKRAEQKEKVLADYLPRTSQCIKPPCASRQAGIRLKVEEILFFTSSLSSPTSGRGAGEPPPASPIEACPQVKRAGSLHQFTAKADSQPTASVSLLQPG